MTPLNRTIIYLDFPCAKLKYGRVFSEGGHSELHECALQALCVSRSYQCGDLRIETLRTYWHFGGVERVFHHRICISFIHLLKHGVRRGFGKRCEQHKLCA